MKVREAIEQLQRCNPNQEVVLVIESSIGMEIGFGKLEEIKNNNCSEVHSVELVAVGS